MKLARGRGPEAALACFLLLNVLAADRLPAAEDLFAWPVQDGKRERLGNDYAQYNYVVVGEHHTGVDIGASPGSTVVAAYGGQVVKIQENDIGCGGTGCGDHGYGNTVIIRHNFQGRTVYTQYSHLLFINQELLRSCGPGGPRKRHICEPAVDIEALDPIGGVGCSRYGLGDCGEDFGSHLHFEVKTFPTLGTGGDDAGEFGYTPARPSEHGYLDPILYLHPLSDSGAKLRVSTGGSCLRVGPGGAAGSAYRTMTCGLGAGRRLQALRLAPSTTTPSCVKGWYQVVPFNSPNGFPDTTNDRSDSDDTILDGWICADLVRDEQEASSLQFTAADFTVGEGGRAAQVTVRREGSAGRATVVYETIDGTAKAGEDYRKATGTLTFEAGVSTQSFSVPILEDRKKEETETISLQLKTPSTGSVIGAQGRARILINDNDSSSIRFEVSSLEITEGGRARVRILREGALGSTVGVSYSTADGEARAGQDYQAKSGSVSFGADDTSREILVPTLTDAAQEGRETFQVRLSQPTGGAALGTSTLTIGILDDSASPVPAISSVSPNPVPGSNSTQTLTIYGSSFESGATVTLRDLTFGGTYPKTPTRINSGELRITANFTNTTATWSVQVTNPGGSSSSQYNFQVQAAASATPSISSVSPNPVPGSNSTQTLAIYGSDFESGATVTLRDLTFGGTYSKTPTRINSGELRITANFTNTTATWSVQVTNPGGSSSSQYSFQVQAASATPSISSVSPNPVPGSNSTQTLAIYGSNFESGATVTLRDLTYGGTYSKTPTYVGNGELRITANFTNTTATWSVQVTNPGGSSSSQYSFQVQAASATPSISSVSPNPVPGSNSTQTLTIYGSNFESGSTVTLRDLTYGGTYSKTPTYVGSSELRITANFTNTTATWSVQVTNPGGSSSSQYSFQVQAASVTPSISSVSPNPVPGSNSTQTLAIYGSNFESGATVTLRDLTYGGTYSKTPTYLGSGELRITANFTNTTATWSVQVTNPGGSSSSQYSFQVQAASVTPSISSVSPNPVPGSNSTQTLTIYGSNFESGSTVTLRDLTYGGTYSKTPTYLGSGELRISANFTNTTATWSVQVTNPGGSSSSQYSFQVQAASVTPSISSVSPNPVPGSNSTQTLTIYGSNFESGSTVTLRDLTYGGTYSKTPTYLGSGELRISANFTNTTATWSVQVTNPGGSSSSQYSFQVQAASVTPSISSVSPNPVPGSNSTQTLRIYGSNFESGSTVTLRDLTYGGTYSKTPTYVGSGELRITANFTNTTATWSVQVTNPGGSSSSQYSFQVQAASVTPSISSVSPNPVPGSNSTQSLTIYGSNFQSGATVTLRDLTYGGTYSKTPTYLSSGELRITANFTNTTATWSVQVTNPGGSSSSQYSFQVQAR